MNTTQVGRQAEQAAVQWLLQNGYQIIDQNWQTRWCEIDIISKKANVIFFVEVRYRRNNAWGDGIDSITPRKLQQMQFAAELWLTQAKWSHDASLCAMAVAGQPPVVSAFIEL